MKNILASILGTLGFCSILNVPKRIIIDVFFGAALSAGIYETLTAQAFPVFTATTAASFAIGIYSEICARLVKTPSTVILLPSTIPLLPGGSLYYAMNSLVNGEYKHFLQYAAETVYTGFGIAVGTILTSICVMTITHFKKRS